MTIASRIDLQLEFTSGLISTGLKDKSLPEPRWLAAGQGGDIVVAVEPQRKAKSSSCT